MSWRSYSLEAFGYNLTTAISGFSRVPPRLVETFQNVAGTLATNTKILDFGCGTGRLSQAFFDVQPSAMITGMEPCKPMGKRAVRRFASNDNLKERFDWVAEPYEYDPLPFEPDSFDLVAATGVFDHIIIDELVMADFFEVIKPGGHLAFTYERKASWMPGSDIGGGDLFVSHKDRYVAAMVNSAGGEIKHQSNMIGYVIPRYARFGVMIAQKPSFESKPG